ncbi:MAG: aminotransferase [Candidatus Zixiibacteriota bacterium]|nr:MAG: aminotransferase [candidate division Zixibacteria bacterium]
MGGAIQEIENIVKGWRFSRNALELKSSIIREILKDSSKPGVINFGGGLPAPDLFPLEKIKEACINVIDKYGTQALQYSLTSGTKQMLSLITSRLKQQDIDISAECIQVTAGAQQALDILGRVFLDPKSVVLTETPTYLGALQAFSFYGVKFISVKTDDEGIIPEDVENKMKEYKPRFIYVVSNFQNPTGRTISLKRREKLVELSRKYGCPVIDDNPYGEVRFTGKHVPSLKTIGKECVIQLGTFSKLISPGLRIGWIASEPNVQKIIERMKQACDLHTNTFTQFVSSEFASAGHLEPHIELIKKVYGIRRNFMIKMLKEYFGDDVSWTEPEGGLFLWLKLPKTINATELLPKAIKAGVAYVPGKFFFSEKPDDSTLRLNFCNATEENIREGVKRLAKVIASAN